MVRKAAIHFRMSLSNLRHSVVKQMHDKVGVHC
jgi:hypothetical protein